MKILYINDYGTPTGGAETMILALRDGMRARGHDARLFASSARPNDAISEADEHCLGTIGSWRTPLQAFNLSARRELKRVLHEFHPDVVHVKLFLTQLSPLILPLLRDVPSLYHAVWYREICPIGTKVLPTGHACRQHAGLACSTNGCVKSWDWPILMGQMKLWRRWKGVFDEIIPVSRAVKKMLAADEIASGEVVPNGVPIRPMRQALDDRPTIAFAGRLVKEKGVDLLLEAMGQLVRQFPASRLLIAGDGPERLRLEQQIAILGIGNHVEFLGHISREAMEERFAGAWAQVVCSRWAEPFGMVAIEAMMRGIAVIASNSGGLAEIVEHGKTGLHVQPNDVKSLVDAIGQILSNRARAEALGQSARAVAMERYSESTCLDRFEEIYRRLIQSGKRAVA